MLTVREKIQYFALYSRIFLLAASALFNLLIPDHSADAFISPPPIKLQECFADQVLKILFGGLLRWDAQYFWHISHYGYTFEHVLAFFPLLPLSIRAVSWPVHILLFCTLNEVSLFLISGVLLNIVCFVKSASLLYELSLYVLKNEKLAYRSAILFCINPASVFFIAPYSETLYTFLTFHGLLKCGSGFCAKFSSDCGLAFGLAALTRSNGILNIGFIVYKYLKDISSSTYVRLLEQSRCLNVRRIFMAPAMLPILVVTAGPYVLSIVGNLLFFMLYQLYAYLKFCFGPDHSIPYFLVEYARAHYLVLPGAIPEYTIDDEVHWCHRSLPLSYSYVQSYYWCVGFLKYYQFQQIPNFLLALPVVWIILSGSWKFMKEHFKYVMFLGLHVHPRPATMKKDTLSYDEELTIPENALPYVIHAVFLTLFCVLFVNVQVTTRMIASSSPVLYWFASVLMEEQVNKEVPEENEDLFECDTPENMKSKWKVFVLTEKASTKAAKFVQLYFLSYSIIGVMLFSNFYPWT